MKTEKIAINKGENKELELLNSQDLDIVLQDDAKLTLKLCYFDVIENIKISAKLHKNAEFVVIFADFSTSSISAKCLVDLLEPGSSCKWRLATLSNGSEHKTFDVSFNHVVGNTVSDMENYGVAKGKSYIDFCGVDHIYEKAAKSNAKQTAKIIVFDPKSSGRASPVLRIDENEVFASHGATVGQLSDEHMFYLMSRGLSREEARRLITYGYLKPISLYFSENNQALIERAIMEDK